MMKRSLIVFGFVGVLVFSLCINLWGQQTLQKFPPTQITVRHSTLSRFIDQLDSLLMKELGRNQTDINLGKVQEIWQKAMSNGCFIESDKLGVKDCFLCKDDELQIEIDSYIQEFLEPDGSLYDHKVSFTKIVRISFIGHGWLDSNKTFSFTQKDIIGYFDWKLEDIKPDSINIPHEPMPLPK